jgi:hypothetical protein
MTDPGEFGATAEDKAETDTELRNKKNPLFPWETRVFWGFHRVGDDGLEPPTSAL